MGSRHNRPALAKSLIGRFSVGGGPENQHCVAVRRGPMRKRWHNRPGAANRRLWLAHASVAQLDRVLPSEGRGHRFESCRMHHSLTALGTIQPRPSRRRLTRPPQMSARSQEAGMATTEVPSPRSEVSQRAGACHKCSSSVMDLAQSSHGDDHSEKIQKRISLGSCQFDPY
jgi:hypothetical protein